MNSLHTRVAAAAVGATAVALAVILSLLLSTFASRERGALNGRLYETLGVARNVVARGAVGEGPNSPFRRSRDESVPAPRPPRLLQVIARNGAGVVVASGNRTIARFGDSLDDRLINPLPEDGGPIDIDVDGTPLRAMRQTVQTTLDGQVTSATVTVMVSRALTDARIVDLRNRILVIGGVGLLLAFLLAGAAARVALRRLERLRREAAAIVPGGSDRLSPGGPIEVDALTSTLNDLLSRVQSTAAERDGVLAASRQFTADAGHELRTPLALHRDGFAHARRSWAFATRTARSSRRSAERDRSARGPSKRSSGASTGGCKWRDRSVRS